MASLPPKECNVLTCSEELRRILDDIHFDIMLVMQEEDMM
jgi:hypothetical protein